MSVTPNALLAPLILNVIVSCGIADKPQTVPVKGEGPRIILSADAYEAHADFDRRVLSDLETLSQKGNEKEFVETATLYFDRLIAIGSLAKGTPEHQRLLALVQKHPAAIDRANELWEKSHAEGQANSEFNSRIVYARRSW